jgi:hypothetical protein
LELDEDLRFVFRLPSSRITALISCFVGIYPLPPVLSVTCDGFYNGHKVGVIAPEVGLKSA